MNGAIPLFSASPMGAQAWEYSIDEGGWDKKREYFLKLSTHDKQTFFSWIAFKTRSWSSEILYTFLDVGKYYYRYKCEKCYSTHRDISYWDFLSILKQIITEDITDYQGTK